MDLPRLGLARPRRADAPHVDREAATVQFRPTVVDDFDDVRAAAAGANARVAKITGVSDDHELVARTAQSAADLVGPARVGRALPAATTST